MSDHLLQSIDLKLSILQNNLDEKLTTLIKLTAAVVVKDKPLKDQIQTLKGFGMSPKDIAETVGTTSNTVRVMLSRKKKESREGSEKDWPMIA